MKIISNIVLAVICLCVFTGVAVNAQAAEPDPLKVGAGQAHATLNSAIASAQEGQVIQIVGNITETNPANPVKIDKKVIIQSNGEFVYTVKGWTKEASPFQITAAGVVVQDLKILISGAMTACSPIEITGGDFNLKRASITLAGTKDTVFSPISVNASGFAMEDVTISSTTTAPVLVDLRGNSAHLKKVSITAGANTTGLYSATSPANLVLDECVFSTTTNSATLVSIPSPDGLSLTNCTFSFTFTAAAGPGCGLIFTETSGATAVKTLTATGCVFNMNAAATAIHLNGYNGVFTGCEFNYSRGGTAISSQSPSNADLAFKNCAFYIGKSSGQKPTYAKGLDLKYNERGNIVIDGCTLIASCDPEAATGAGSALIISSTDGTLRSLTVNNSSIALNTGSNSATGIVANTELLTVTKSNFKSNARAARCIVVNGVADGNISDSVFDIAQLETAGLSLTNSNKIHLKNNIYNLSASGTGVAMTNAVPGESAVVAENNEINVKDTTSQGLLLENLSRLDVKNGNKIKSVSGGKNSAGIRANQIKTVEIDDLELDLNGVTQGVVIDGTRFPQGEEGSARITNTSAKLSEGAAKVINAIYANGVSIDNFYGECVDTAVGAHLLAFSSSVNVSIRNSIFNLYKSSTGINVAAALSGEAPTDANGQTKDYISGNHEIDNNKFYVGEKSKAIFSAGKYTHNTSIHHNMFKADKSDGIVNVGYGRNQAVYDNVFEANDSMVAIVSDGVDETTEFTMEADSDIYDSGNIIEAYRNQIYNNQLKGSYERGIYVTNNGDVVRDNDLSKASFHYEFVPGRMINTQILVAYCKDVKILNNQFAKLRAADIPVVRVNNATISEVTGNTTQPVDCASEVLFAQGVTAVSTSGIKYPEKIEVHDVTNTINGITPTEIVKEWNDPDNLIYEYILRAPVYPYTVEYYKDSVSDENRLAVEQGVSGFMEGHVLKSAEVASDLGGDWLLLYRPDGYPNNIASNIDSLVIKSDAAENVVIVVYLPNLMPIAETGPDSYYIRPIAYERGSVSGANEMYVELDEPDVPLGPPPVYPNPQMGRSGALSLYAWEFTALITALLGALFITFK